MASCEATEATSAPISGPLGVITGANGKLITPSKWGPVQLNSLRIQLVDADQSIEPVPGDRTLAVENDTDALEALFKERDEYNPGCYSINQAFATAVTALEDRGTYKRRKRLRFRLGNCVALLRPTCYIMVGIGVPGVAVNNPANVYFEQQNVLVDYRTPYRRGVVEGEVDPVNVVQLIIIAQAQAKAMNEGTISNKYPLSVGALWVAADGRTIQAYYSKVSKEYLDGLQTPDQPLPVALTVYQHTFEINENNIANDSSDNGFANAMRFAQALVSEIEVVPDTEPPIDWETAHGLKPSQLSGLETEIYKSAEDGE